MKTFLTTLITEPHRMSRAVISTFLAMAVAGCATNRPVAAVSHTTGDRAVEVQRGRDNAVIDGTGWIIGIPSKLALWDRRADNHDISPETEQQLVEYLNEHELDSVLVRVNQYDPWGEWQRLASSRQVGFGWRYTFGLFNTLKYTLLAGRIFGEDWYNPYTNTINIYSDIPSLALAEAAYARDVRHRRFPGAYAAVQELPIVGMWHETVATRDVLDYVKRGGTDAERDEAYRILYPAYGGNWGAGLATFVPFGSLYGRLGGAAVGHAANGVRKVVNIGHETLAARRDETKKRQ